LGDRSVGTGNTLWSDTDLDIALDTEFGNIWNDLIKAKSPLVNTVSYTTTTASTVDVTLPSNFAGEVKWVNVADGGDDLSSDSQGAPRTELILTDAYEGWKEYKRGQLGTQPYYFSIAEGGTGKIFPPPNSGGTSACEICHTYWPTFAAATTSEPGLPTEYRPLIAIRAAISLRLGYDMPVQELRGEERVYWQRMLGIEARKVQDRQQSFSATGRVDSRQFAIKTGFRRALKSYRSRFKGNY
jgi:hypothetical protein